jgi:hypothetical protein
MKTYKNFKLIAMILGLMLVINTATASLLIEPHVGYNISGSGDSGGVEYDYSGPQLGARLGYQNLGFMTGLDYTRSSGEMDTKSSAGKSTQDFESNDLGVFVGYNFPILLRAWGTYYFTNTMKLKGSGLELSGNTKELGVGFTALPFLSVNVMYRMVTHDEAKGSTGTVGIDRDYNEIVLGVSLPLTL